MSELTPDSVEVMDATRVLRWLHVVTQQVAAAPSVHDALDCLLAAAIELHGAQFGTLQAINGATHQLETAAQRGFADTVLDALARVDAANAGTAARALQTQQTVAISDLEKDQSFASLQAVGAQAGFRAVHATPLLNRSGASLGVLSVHFRDPHTFTERDAQVGALIGRQAADLIGSRLLHLDASASRLTTTGVRQLLARLVHVQEEERRRLARDIHDQMGQQMTALRMTLNAMQRSAAPEVAAQAARAAKLADDLDRSIDFVMWELRPAGIELSELPDALSDLVRHWSEHFGIDAVCECVGGGGKLPLEISVNLYRIAQEALHNIYKHAKATHVNVMIEIRTMAVMLTIEDDGGGFDIAALPDDEQVGLIAMRERALLIGGALQIESAPGEGTTVFVRVPLGGPELSTP